MSSLISQITRNLTAVYIDGEYKVAQYGAWDGYPGGQGMTCLNFLKQTMVEEKFKAALRKCSFIAPQELRDLCGKYTKSKDGWALVEEVNRIIADHPELSGTMGAAILELVQNHPDGIKLQNSIEFAADGLFCEWAWVIDFDKRTFEGYSGFGHDPLTEEDRFYFLKDKEKNGYSGVRLRTSFSLDDLPSDEDFLATFKDEDEED